MAIYKGDKKVIALYKGNKPIIKRYKGTQLIYDATSSEPINETLSFAWSGTSATMQYKINNTTKTATTNPYSATLTELGIDKFTNATQMFYNKAVLTAVTSIPDTSNVTNMYYMFRGCSNLTSLDVTKTMNTSSCTNMGYMFAYCGRLTSLDLSSFDTSKVTNMGYMFYNSKALTEINLSGWDMSNVTSFDAMFGNGVKPTKVIMNGCDCDTQLKIRQQIANNGLDHIAVVSSDINCIKYEEYQNTYSYNINVNNSYTASYDKYIYPDSVTMITNITDLYGVTSRTSTNITGYSVEFTNQDGVIIEGNNESGEIRTIYANVYYKDENIGKYEFKQDYYKEPTTGWKQLSCDTDRTTPITELRFDRSLLDNNVGGYWWAAFNNSPSEGYDCSNCDWSGGNIQISVHEDNIQGYSYKGMSYTNITNLPMEDGYYIMYFEQPIYFRCGEVNYAFNCTWYLSESTSSNVLSFKWNADDENQSITLNINNNEQQVYGFDCVDNGDGTYTYNGSKDSELFKNGLISCESMFANSQDKLVELISFPDIDFNITNMANMFNACRELTSINLSNIDVSNVTDMSRMFYMCERLTSLDLSGWNLDVQSIVNYNAMFRYCDNLQTITMYNCEQDVINFIQQRLSDDGINATILNDEFYI